MSYKIRKIKLYYENVINTKLNLVDTLNCNEVVNILMIFAMDDTFIKNSGFKKYKLL